MNNKYPMVDGGPLFSLYDFGVLLRRIKLKILNTHGNAQCIDISDNKKDAIMDFCEFPSCESCGASDHSEILIAVDGNRVVECAQCGLWYTSPRINESTWMQWLASDSKRNEEFTENRLKFGVALNRNIPYSFSFWWRVTRYQRQKQIKKLCKYHGGKPKRLFDVGCGSGYLLKAAYDMGIEVSGNDLNNYAVTRIRQLFGFNVHTGVVYELVENNKVERNSFDIVYMNDYIEHSYHPKKDIGAAAEMLANGGILYLHTFCVDSDIYKRLGNKWDMLMWNHCYHFSSTSLAKMVEDAGLHLIHCEVNKTQGMVEILGIKK